MKIPPFNAPHHEDSADDMRFIFLRSIVTEYDQSVKIAKIDLRRYVYTYIISLKQETV